MSISRSARRGSPPVAARPVGSGAYVVKQGECLDEIARSRGFHWTTLWDHPSNRKLRDARKSHNILLPGDRVFIPERRPSQEACPTAQRHTFQLKGTKSTLRLRLLYCDDAEPYANQPFRLEVDGEFVEGTVDADGNLEARIDARAKRARLHVAGETLDLVIGGLDPVDSVSGAQQRLSALGFLARSEPHGTWDADSVEGLRRFQSSQLIPPTGEYDDQTQAKLAEAYGC